MRLISIIGVAIFAAGCSAILANNAIEKLRAECEAKGGQLVETETKTTELLVVSSATVSGTCVGPGDPRYVAPAPKMTL